MCNKTECRHEAKNNHTYLNCIVAHFSPCLLASSWKIKFMALNVAVAERATTSTRSLFPFSLLNSILTTTAQLFEHSSVL